MIATLKNLSCVLQADAIHAGLPQEARELAMRRVRLGELWALVCTEVLARGIDLKHIQTVVNYDFPQTMVSYVHRIGRTGRAGTDKRLTWVCRICVMLKGLLVGQGERGVRLRSSRTMTGSRSDPSRRCELPAPALLSFCCWHDENFN